MKIIANVFMVMKLIVLLLITSLVHVHASTYAQRVTLKERGVPLEKIFESIRQQSGYGIIYDTQAIKSLTVTVDVTNVPVDDALSACLDGLPLTYQIMGKDILVRADTEPRTVDPLTNHPGQQSQRITVHGAVSDSTGVPLVGATVRLLSTDRQAMTDQRGRFAFQDVSRGAQIEISMLGYVKQIRTAEAEMVIHLPQTDQSIGEVVVTGLFERRGESFTGSTNTFSQQQLIESGNQNVLRSVANLDPSFRILENLQFGSDPNHLPDIQMRGQTGLPDLNNEYGTNPNLPLFILDGFEADLQRVLDLDMYLVKSLTLLKDAASKAVYGSRAANGVVVIETLRPPAGALQVTYNFNLNVDMPDLSSYNVANARQKVEIEMMTDPSLLGELPWTDGGNWGQTSPIRREYEQKWNEVLRGVDTYWLSQPLRNGVGQRHSVTLGGGRDELQYYVELGYNNIKGVMMGSERNNYSGGIQLAYRKSAISVSNILRLTANRGDNSPFGSFRDFAEANPYLRLRDSVGKYNFYSPMHNGTVGVQDFSTESNVLNNTEVVWTILPYLRLNGRLGIGRVRSEADIFLPATHNSFVQPDPSGDFDPNSMIRGSYRRASAHQDRFNTTIALNYNQVFGRHAVYANLGGDANSISGENYAFQVVGFPNANLNFLTAAVQYAPESRLNGTENITRDIGVYAALNYAFDDRFLADLTWRNTRSSQFGPENPDAQFWSAGLGWNLHNESFMRNLGVFDVLRLFANTGYTGTQPLAAYLGFPVYRYQMDNLYYGKYALRLHNMANPMLGAQRKRDNNFGLNMGLLDNRLNLSADYYISITDGLIIDLNLPYSTGYSSFKANQGKVANEGIDLRANYQVARDERRANFITLHATLGHNKNRLKELSNSLIALTSSQDTIMSAALKQRFEVGSSLHAIWAVPSLGIDPATGKEVFLKKDGTLTYEWDAADQVTAGDAIADLYGNFGFSVRYQGWQFNTSFAYNIGGQKYNTTLVSKVENIDRTKNVDARVFTSRWKQPGDQVRFKGINEKGVTYPTTRFVEDWNELTLANANLSYDLDRLSFVKNAGIRRLRASLVVDNAFVFSTIAIERGTDYPFARTFSFTLLTNF